MKFIFFLFSFCFFFSFAAKSESYIWGDFNGWEVGVNSGTNFGCYAMSPNYEDGSLLKIGYINMKKVEVPFYLYLGNLNWTSFTSGALYPMQINFEPSSIPYDGDAIIENTGGYSFLSFKINAEFVKEFSQKDSIDFLYEGNSVAYLTLRGSFIAIKELVACQLAVAEAGVANTSLKGLLKKKSPRDPFQK